MSLQTPPLRKKLRDVLKQEYPLFCPTAQSHVPPRHHLTYITPKSDLYIVTANVGISGRHVHLSDRDFGYLFDGDEWQPKIALTQPGQFVDDRSVWLKHGDIYIRDAITKNPKNVALLGPGRGESQIEILPEDFPHLHIPQNLAQYVSEHELKIDAPLIDIHKHVPYRMSGNLKNTPEMTVVNPLNNREITVPYGTILAPPHAHMSVEQAREYGIVDKEEVYGIIRLNGEPIGISQRLPVRVSDRFSLDTHFELNYLTREYIGASREGKLTIDLCKGE